MTVRTTCERGLQARALAALALVCATLVAPAGAAPSPRPAAPAADLVVAAPAHRGLVRLADAPARLARPPERPGDAAREPRSTPRLRSPYDVLPPANPSRKRVPSADDGDSLASAYATARAPLPPIRGGAKSKPGPLAAAGFARGAGGRGIPRAQVALIGVMNLSTGRRALVRMPSGETRRVKIGDRLAGWEVGWIGETSLRIARGAEALDLPLRTR